MKTAFLSVGNSKKLFFYCKTKTTGCARGSKKAMPMSRKDKPPAVQWEQVCRPHLKVPKEEYHAKEKRRNG